jgi:hypothetical protein
VLPIAEYVRARERSRLSDLGDRSSDRAQRRLTGSTTVRGPILKKKGSRPRAGSAARVTFLARTGRIIGGEG